MTDFESRQLSATTDTTRSSWSEDERKRFKRLWDADEAKQRQQSESIRQMNADMADLIEHAKAGEFREQGQD